MRVSFTVPGMPVAKGRPRFVNRGKFVQTYTPESTTNYENLVKLSYTQESSVKLSGELYAVMTFCFPIPKSVSKKKHQEMAAGIIRPTKKPDIDNCIKAILDALNGIAFDDDSQVVCISADKLYSEKPCVIVILEEFEDSFHDMMNPPEV